MDANVKKLWLNNLRSGEFEQGIYAMCKKDGDKVQYDPLGVLIETVLGDKVWSYTKDNFDAFVPTGFGSSQFPNKKFLQQVRLDEETANMLCELNDVQGRRFEDIANFIEENVF
jgi:hypothetical protein